MVFAFNAGDLVMSWEGFSFKWFAVALANVSWYPVAPAEASASVVKPVDDAHVDDRARLEKEAMRRVSHFAESMLPPGIV